MHLSPKTIYLAIHGQHRVSEDPTALARLLAVASRDIGSCTSALILSYDQYAALRKLHAIRSYASVIVVDPRLISQCPANVYSWPLTLDDLATSVLMDPATKVDVLGPARLVTALLTDRTDVKTVWIVARSAVSGWEPDPALIAEVLDSKGAESDRIRPGGCAGFLKRLRHPKRTR